MDRNNPFYKLRRQAQVLAFHILPHETLSKLYFQILLHYTPNLKKPETLNEKLQWLKLFYYPENELAVRCTDKYEVRDYVASKGLQDRLTPLLGVWNNADEIRWDSLPEQFVLKCTHGCAYNIVCQSKRTFDPSAAAKQLSKWLKENFAAFNVELHYGKIAHHRIIAEQFLGDNLIDYKFFCFHGTPRFFYVSSDLIHDRQAKMGFFDLSGKKIPLIRNDYEDIGTITPPDCFAQMVEAAKTLSADFPFVRVDFFLANSTFYFAELTFTPSAAMMSLNPASYDAEWGKLLNIDELMNQYENS